MTTNPPQPAADEQGRPVAEDRKDSIIAGMCMTWDHGFGLMSGDDQSALWRQMEQLFEHDVKPLLLPAQPTADEQEKDNERVQANWLVRRAILLLSVLPVGEDTWRDAWVEQASAHLHGTYPHPTAGEQRAGTSGLVPAERMEPLGAEFEKVWHENYDALHPAEPLTELQRLGQEFDGEEVERHLVLDMDRGRVVALASVGLMLETMNGEGIAIEGHDGARLYDEVIMALGIEDADHIVAALETARDYPEGELLSDRFKAIYSIAAMSPRSSETYAAFQQRRGRLPDLIDEALGIYDEFMKDDAYQAQVPLDAIAEKLRSARDWYDVERRPRECK